MMKLVVLPVLLFFASGLHSIAPASNVDHYFHGIDFKNRSYPYRFSWGKHKLINVLLKNGEYEYDVRDERGWFNLKNVYLTNLTGDRRPEAIVMIWHVACGVSCDGGSALFYLYSFDNHRLKPLWQYETGDNAYGCGLKSFATKRRTMTLELFGRCSPRNRTASSMGKSLIKDLTRVTFKWNGTGFVVRKRQFFSIPERSVLNYEPQIDVAP
jgi:hypothetical protein